MPIWLQNIVVLTLVAACGAVVIRGALRTLWGKASQIGKCCSRGCAAHPKPGASQPGPAKAAERVVFLPADALRVRAKHR